MQKNINLKPLTKNQEKLIISLSRRKKRREQNLCICEGLRACTEVYNSSPNLIRYAVVTESFKIEELPVFEKIDFYVLPDSKFKRLISPVNPQGILLVAETPSYSKDQETSNISQPPFILVLDRISDPGNLGTIIRTALSVGLDEIWYSSGTVDPFSEKTIRSALGAQFKIRLKEFDDLPLLVKKFAKQGYNTVYRTEPAGGESCFDAKDLFHKSMIIFGNEASGVEEIKDSIPLHIPMPGGFESINVAQAVTVILFEAVRRKIF